MMGKKNDSPHQLSKEAMQALKKLHSDGVISDEGFSSAQHLADGGDVTPVDLNAQISPEQIAAAQAALAGGSTALQPDPGSLPYGTGDTQFGTNQPLNPQQSIADEIQARTQAAGEQTIPVSTGPAPASDPAQTPSDPATQPAPGPAGNLVPTQQQAQQPNGDSPQNPLDQELKQMNQGYDQERSGLQTLAGAKDSETVATVKAIDQTVTTMNALQNSWQQRESDWHKNSQEYVDRMQGLIQQQVNAPGLNPNRLMSNMSTGGKIAAAISLMMGGLAGGLSGRGGNIAVDILNRAIDRDVEAQKFDYERSQNTIRNQASMYGMMRDQFQDDRNSDMMTRSGMLEVAKLQLQKASAQTQNIQAHANAQQMLGELTIKQAQLNSQIYMNKYRMQAMGAATGAGGVPGGALNAGIFKDDEIKRAVKLPSGNYGFATSDDQAKEANKAATKYDQINATLDQIQKLKDSAGRSLPKSEAATQAGSLSARLAPMLNEYYGINRLSDTDFEHVLKPQIPDASAFLQGDAQTRIDTLRGALQKDHDIMLRHNVIGYQPANFTPKGRP